MNLADSLANLHDCRLTPTQNLVIKNAFSAKILTQLGNVWLTLAIALLKQRLSGLSMHREPVAQLVERLTFNEDVHGSNPCGLTTHLITNVPELAGFEAMPDRV